MEEQAPQQAEDLVKSEGLLYHYTDQRGLDGILASDTIWATHYRFLNDLTERKIGFDTYLNAIEKVLNSRQHLLPGSIDAWRKIALNYFEASAAFSVSFSRDRENEKTGQAGDHYGKQCQNTRVTTW